MKILLTGAGGFLGSRALQALRRKHEVIPLSSTFLRGKMTQRQQEELYNILTDVGPDVILNTAAISDTGFCEEHPEMSYQANVLLPEALGQMSQKLCCKLVLCSSDQVYNGVADMTPSAETREVQPLNVYGRHKLEAEQRVAELCPEAVQLRLTWMYDMPSPGLPVHPNIITNLLRAGFTGEKLRCSTRDLRGVTYVGEVVAELPKTFDLPGGVYNFGSESDRSTYETVRAWLALMGHEDRCEQLLEPLEGPARNLAMNCDKALHAGVHFSSSVQGFGRLRDEYAPLFD